MRHPTSPLRSPHNMNPPGGFHYRAVLRWIY